MPTASSPQKQFATHTEETLLKIGRVYMQNLIFGFSQITGGLGHEIHIPRRWQLGGTDFHRVSASHGSNAGFLLCRLQQPRSLL